MAQFEPFYIDQRGWTYSVQRGIGHSYKPRYRRQGPFFQNKWRWLASVPWRETKEEAEADMLMYAKQKHMNYIEFVKDPRSGHLTARAVSAIERKINHG